MDLGINTNDSCGALHAMPAMSRGISIGAKGLRELIHFMIAGIAVQGEQNTEPVRL